MTDAITGVKMDERLIVDRADPDGDDAIAGRHRQLRGTDSLLYYPPDRACRQRCGCADNEMGKLSKPLLTHHQCYLAPAHDSDCVFSSECLRSVIKSVPAGVIQAATAVVA